MKKFFTRSDEQLIREKGANGCTLERELLRFLDVIFVGHSGDSEERRCFVEVCGFGECLGQCW